MKFSQIEFSFTFLNSNFTQWNFYFIDMHVVFNWINFTLIICDLRYYENWSLDTIGILELRTGGDGTFKSVVSCKT